MKKVFFDTNFLLRFYLDDIPTQALKAKRMVQSAKEGAILLVTDLIVICEMVWVMDSFYNLEKEVISEKITNLYRTPGVVVFNGDVLPDALSIYITKILVSEFNLIWFSKVGFHFFFHNVKNCFRCRRFENLQAIGISRPPCGIGNLLKA